MRLHSLSVFIVCFAVSQAIGQRQLMPENELFLIEAPREVVKKLGECRKLINAKEFEDGFNLLFELKDRSQPDYWFARAIFKSTLNVDEGVQWLRC